MSAFTAVFLIGAAVTAVAFAVLFAKRHPNPRGWLVLGIVIGLVAMFLWPVTLWVAVAMWLTGFARPPSPETPAGRRKRLVIPLCSVGALTTLIVIGSTAGPAPALETDPVAAPTTSSALPPITSSSPPPTTVIDVVDGDTVVLNNAIVVRIIGIDSPETVAPGEPDECWGLEATEFARQTLLDNSVAVVADPTQDQVDNFGRTLSYIMLPDGRDFSVLAAEGGHARAYIYGTAPPQHFGAILAAESQARVASLGLWGPACAPPTPGPAQVEAPRVAEQERQARAAREGEAAVDEARRRADAPAPAPAPSSESDCEPGYSPCVPSYPPDLDCGDLAGPYRVTGADPHKLDGNDDGLGCE